MPSYKAVRTSRWIWVEYSDGSRELYDLARDPQQLRSRHADRRYRRTRAALRKELGRLAKCKGKSCRRQAARIPGPSAALEHVRPAAPPRSGSCRHSVNLPLRNRNRTRALPPSQPAAGPVAQAERREQVVALVVDVGHVGLARQRCG